MAAHGGSPPPCSLVAAPGIDRQFQTPRLVHLSFWLPTQPACENWAAPPVALWTPQRQQTPPAAHLEEHSAVIQGK